MSAAGENAIAQIGVRVDAFGARTDALGTRIDALTEAVRAQSRLLRVILALQTASLVGAIILLFRT